MLLSSKNVPSLNLPMNSVDLLIWWCRCLSNLLKQSWMSGRKFWSTKFLKQACWWNSKWVIYSIRINSGQATSKLILLISYLRKQSMGLLKSTSNKQQCGRSSGLSLSLLIFQTKTRFTQMIYVFSKSWWMSSRMP